MNFEDFYAELSCKLNYKLNDERLRELLMEKGQDLNNITLKPQEYDSYKKMISVSEYAMVIGKSYITIIRNKNLLSKKHVNGKILLDYAEDCSI